MSSPNASQMWDERYGQEEYAYGTVPNDYLVSVAEKIPMGRVLCLCEGEGRNGVYLAERGLKVVGVDSSANGLRKARELAVKRGVAIETIVADLADFEIEPSAWDGIISIFAHLPPHLRRRIHRQVVAGLRPGGVFVLEAYTPNQIGRGTGGPSHPELTMRLSALKDELEGLEFVLGQEIEREIQEGKFHAGLSSVVQVLAHK